ncbi:MAG TPA: polysaccharide biosynthesis tyrosine autokinase [Bryobacteraceae bacterium]|jgi:capsular exopolysaccharide synthesis family protein
MARIDNGWNSNSPVLRPRQGDFAVSSQINQVHPTASVADNASAVLEYWNLIKRRKWVVLITAILGAVIAFGVLVVKQPIYIAATTFELQGLNTSFMNLANVDPLSSNYSVNKENISTEIRILTSGSIRGPVMERLRREIAPVTAPRSGTLAPLRALLRGKEDPLLEMKKGLGIAAGSLRATSILGTRIISVSAESTIPEIASTFVNTLVQEYQQQSAQQRTVNSQQTSQWLATQLEETRSKVEQAENRMQEFTRKSGGIFLGGEKETFADVKLKQLQGELASAQVDRLNKQGKYETIKASPSDSLPEIVDDANYRQLQIKLGDAKADLAKLNVTLTPANPKVQKAQETVTEINAQMQAQKDAIVLRFRNDYETALKHEQLLGGAYAGQTGTVSGQSDKAAEYAQLKREVDLYSSSLNAMLSQMNQSAVAAALPTANVRVIDAANPPALPYKPNAQVYEIYGLLLGAGGGVLLILVVDKFSTWRSSLIFGMPGYSPKVLKVPELGVIPSIGSDRRHMEAVSGRRWSRLLPSGSANRNQQAPAVLLSATTDGSIQAESFRLALTSILLMSHGGRQPRIIVVTSAGPGEGKTTVVSNMAVAIAESGRKVLIIDADLRRPRMHSIFGIEKNEGFAELVTSAKGARSERRAPTVCQTHIKGVFVLPSGIPSDANLGQIFHSPEIPALLDNLLEEFDLILIDTPPMIQFSDARLMARVGDGLILVVRSGVTARDSAVAAREQLAQDNVNVLGTILNDWDARANLKHPYHPYYNYGHYQPPKTTADSSKNKSGQQATASEKSA